jgi:hypothetical protein
MFCEGTLLQFGPHRVQILHIVSTSVVLSRYGAAVALVEIVVHASDPRVVSTAQALLTFRGKNEEDGRITEIVEPYMRKPRRKGESPLHTPLHRTARDCTALTELCTLVQCATL